MENREVIAGATEGTLHYLEDRATKLLDVVIGDVVKDLYKHGKEWWPSVWRRLNAARVFNRSAEIIDVAKIFPKPLPPSVFVPMMDAASNVDDPTLSEMFSRLLASAIVGESEAQKPIFRTTLERMSGVDGRVFEAICEVINERRRHMKANQRTPLSSLEKAATLARERFGIPDDEFDSALHTLETLSLVETGGTDAEGKTHEVGYLSLGGRLAAILYKADYVRSLDS